MTLELKKRFWLGAMAVVAALLALAGPSIIAGVKDTASASSGCGMDHSSSAGGCGMMDNNDSSGMMGGMGSMHKTHNGCAMLTGRVIAVNRQDGSVTIKLRPANTGEDAARKAFSRINVGDDLSMAVVMGNDGRPASANQRTKVQAAKYACPMHPEVTSDKPGKCPKCGMTLERIGGAAK